jgi:hypothetical protein
METHTLDGHLGRPVTIDLCHSCQAFWFDTRESLSLTPGSTLTLFRIIGEHAAHPQATADTAKCPRCRARLRHTHDMQRDTRFQYFACPKGHGRLTSFFDFLKEKNFIRPLSAQQIAELRRNVQTVNCSNCGAPVDLSKGTACEHCGSPLSMLDMKQAEALVSQLRKAEDRTRQPVDPSLPLELARARRDVEASFSKLEGHGGWLGPDSSNDLVWAGLNAIARWMKNT